MSSLTSQTLTFMPAITAPRESQNAMNSAVPVPGRRGSDLVGGARRGQARAFHAEVVLVAEEIRHPVVADGLAEHGPGGGRAAVQRVGPVLDADPAAEQRVERVRDVAGGEDVLIGGAQGRVGQHAVGDFEPGAGGQVVVRGRADADDQDVGRDFGAAGRDDHAGAELDRPLAEAEFHAVRLVQAGEDGAELGAELVVQRAGLRLEHGHRAVGQAGGRGGLQADPAGPATTTRVPGWNAERSRSESPTVRR